MSHVESSTCSTPQKNASGEDSDSDFENENIRPRGLTGLQNLGNTCYLNSALQSLSNCPPLTRYFLDCPQLIRPEKTPMLSRSYLKLITELWHKKRPSYVVPSGVVTGIKAVHPMFRGYTQQDAQEFLRCLMDQLHEELKAPYSDDSDSEDEEDDGGGGDDDDGSNNANNGDALVKRKISQSDSVMRRSSFDSVSSQSELEYETCESGLSSERSSNGGQDNGSSDENNSDTNEMSKRKQSECLRKLSAANSLVSDITDSVANTKEMKETANLLEKISEAETQGRRQPRGKAVMEGGDSKEQGSSASYITLPGKESEGPTNGVQATTLTQIPTQQQSPVPKSPVKPAPVRKVKNTRYNSIISQTFDGKILSSVRCLNCETVSTTKETFQDLSLPIPSKDHLHMLHAGYSAAGGVNPPKGGTCGEVHQSWFAWMFSWMKSWFIGPTITLQDCLSAFFSADELKGDNMYSCEKCKKLRNGLKYSKVLELPEILSIHLKRFRHEFYSSKISTYISFPLEGLDMEPYLHKACKNEVTIYDLVAIICHHGTAGGGHYTAYCLNRLNEQWYEFDDQYVTEVDISQVQNCEAYVLFYRKSNRKIEGIRQRVLELEQNETSILKFYISKQWVSRFHTFAEPGPITNKDFLCKHGGVPPGKVGLIDDLVVEIHQSMWELLYSRFGGGPVCNHLYACKTCHSELEKLRQRQFSEKDSFIQLNEEFQGEEHSVTVYAISMAWFKEWEAFVREKTDIPPGPIDNSRIIVYKNGQPTLRQTSDYGQLSKDMWQFLHRIYGGGPELIIRQAAGAAVKPTSSSPTPQQNLASGTLQAVASSSSLSSSPSFTGLSQTGSNTSAALSCASSTASSVPQSSAVPSPERASPVSAHLASSSSVTSSKVCHSYKSVEGETQGDSLHSSGVSASPVLVNIRSSSQEEAAGQQDCLHPGNQPQDQRDDDSTQKQNHDLTLPDTSRAKVEKENAQNLATVSQSSALSPVKSCVKDMAVSSAPVSLSNGTKTEPTPRNKPSASAPSSWVSLAQPKTQSMLPATSSISPKTQDNESDKLLSQAYNSWPVSEPRAVNPCPSCKEEGKTSDESLPDSGMGTDHSCSGHDLPTPQSISAEPGLLLKPEPSALNASSNNTTAKASSPVEGHYVAHSQIPSVTTAATTPTITNFGKGKKKNKKGKTMDVTRI